MAAGPRHGAMETGSALKPNRPGRRVILRHAGRALAFGCVYFLADIALNGFAFSEGWTILWPLNGITIALLIMRPRSQWASMLLGVEAGIACGEYLDNSTVNSPGPEVIQRLISLTEVVLSALLLPAFTTLEDWLRKPRIFPRFVAALAVGPAVSGVMAAAFFHVRTGQSYITGFDDWAAADALGIAAIMPLALSFRSREMRELFRGRTSARTIFVLGLTFVCAAAVFSVSRYPLLFLLYPAILFADSLLGFAGSAIAVLGACLIAVYFTTQGLGPFGVWPRDLAVTSNVALQLYLGFQLVALFPASIMILERRRMGSELRETNAQLVLLASLDGLTGLANRRCFDEVFGQEWTRALRSQVSLALIVIDIDNFKQFNDIYGHHGGDGCLQAVAGALQDVPKRAEDHLARFGGEEFAMLLPQADIDGAMRMAERLRDAVLQLDIEHEGSQAGHVTISLGCAALTPTPGEERVLLFEMADAALYEAKRTGRNRSLASALCARPLGA